MSERVADRESNSERVIAVAPMMGRTDRHCRYFHRLLSSRVLLYTEMITSAALVRGCAHHLLEFNEAEHAVALQLGGSDPRELADAAQLGANAGYDEINLNVGCPSDRVQSGGIGAILMKTPKHLAHCLEAMCNRVTVNITVKCRIGVDEQRPEEILPRFLATVFSAGCKRVIIHARKAVLSGLSPKKNREIPPLDYPLIYEMKNRFSEKHISINGGINSLTQTKEFLDGGLDGVMIGRAAYDQPAQILGQLDQKIFGTDRISEPLRVGYAMLPYIEAHLQSGGRLNQVTRHMMGLFSGLPGSKLWRQTLNQESVQGKTGSELVDAALACVAERNGHTV
ncbi:MAG: tRNA dihydrouridine(20/20a) synthase DusA [Aestuariivita sp.]|nr:tRNA dihydrouridine(20/20a) synthase DusA [Aestuariivita sp.]MCY4203066.1 tRNA dihydrouridine(20/20a) synthase DusA [Aestuariivita sp.]MCY4289338.1 tRNA dihydrouridine(20/20a) synthase DusA [Aestuariivita sp.]MCY4347779.1 tRNA dihydrouridine(20/20a) synthase DusA [Aestuariivita sp.]